MKRLLLTLLALPTLAFAQNERKNVRFIPLGELPDWKEELKEGVRVQTKPPEGALPPTIISAPNGPENIQQKGLTLRQPTGFMTFGPQAEGLSLHEGEVAAGAAWLKSPMPTSAFSFGVLFRDNAEMTWKSPRMLMLSDTAEALPAGNIRFVNVSDLKAIVKVGAKSEVIQPGGVLIKPLQEGDNPILAGYYDKSGAVVMIFQNSVRLMRNQRVQAFFFKGQGDKPRTDVKFISFPEPVPS
ncbi:MAG: hypothetical protein QNL33_10775 [Akkermansiaceae bacterium]|jgi:hypothetical protein